MRTRCDSGVHRVQGQRDELIAIEPASELAFQLIQQAVELVGTDLAPDLQPSREQVRFAKHRVDVEHDASRSPQGKTDPHPQDLTGANIVVSRHIEPPSITLRLTT